MSTLAVTWWGHSTATVELGPVRVGTDPLLVDRLVHLVRHAPTPATSAAELDVVLVSHLHGDHLHVPSQRQVDRGVPRIVPRGAAGLLRGVADDVREVVPGDQVSVHGLTVDVLPAHHDGRRTPWSRRPGEALGFRVTDGSRSFWYPGDTGADPRFSDVAPVDLALVPIGGWGPTLGPEHLDPEQAADAVEQVGARWAVPVHHGTFWPVGLRVLARDNHRRLFQTPGGRFADALADRAVTAIVPAHGERVGLVGEDPR